MVIIQVSGTRYARQDRHREVLERALRPYGLDFSEPVTLRHGDAEGVDEICGLIGAAWGWTVEAYPARWWECGEGCPPRPHLEVRRGRPYCPISGPRRNRAMLLTKPAADIILTFPAIGSHGRGGTWGFMGLAADLGMAIDRMGPLAVEIPTRTTTLPGLEVVRGAA